MTKEKNRMENRCIECGAELESKLNVLLEKIESVQRQEKNMISLSKPLLKMTDIMFFLKLCFGQVCEKEKS